mmetsp:Transcript_48379/g.134085  ORF Transcript_48379/g.134085 Transcript_48379/m.134085 type:complete len:249 (-) Transcript_48379:30-776(-)
MHTLTPGRDHTRTPSTLMLLPPHPFHFRSAHRFLFGSPRAYIRDIGRCVMRHAGLLPRRFFSVHARDSPEKSMELKGSRAGREVVADIQLLAEGLSQATGMRRVFLQTASPTLLVRILGWAANSTLGLNVSHTENSRSDHDSWGGWRKGLEMEQGVVAAVNAWIAAQAAVIITPRLSMWSLFLRGLIQRRSNDPRGGSRELTFSCLSRRETRQVVLLVRDPRRVAPLVVLSPCRLVRCELLDRSPCTL